MIRILGVISGAAISLAALTWFVGVPQFTSERVLDDMTVHVPPLSTGEAAPPPPPAAVAGPAVGNTAPPDAAVAETPPDVEAEPVETMETIEIVETPEPAPPIDSPPIGPPPIDTPAELHWFAFWSPFRSEIAANGFVGELQRVTGLDYRVVKVEPGVYEVAFAYAEDDEIDLNLSTISAATGLNLPGTQ